MEQQWEEFMAAMIALGESLREAAQELGQKEKETAEAFEESEHSWPRTVRVTRVSNSRSRRPDIPEWYPSGFR